MQRLGGQSAGGESTMQQFLWTDEDLFRSAWIMSSPTRCVLEPINTVSMLTIEQHRSISVSAAGFQERIGQGICNGLRMSWS